MTDRTAMDVDKSKLFFKNKRILFFVLLVAVVAITFGAGMATKFDVMDGFRAIPRVVSWFGANLLPLEWTDSGLQWEETAINRIPKIAEKLLETIFLSIMATMTASVFAFLTALLGSKTTMMNKPLAYFSRAVSSVSRNIPVAAWAMIFLMSFGQSLFTGFLALFFYSYGFLSRVFVETIDEASGDSVQALKASGALYSQVVVQAVLPSSLPQMLSWILFMIETNIRSATLVGILTGSGIGFIFSLYYKNFQYKSAFLIVIFIVAVVLAIEFISNKLRRVFL